MMTLGKLFDTHDYEDWNMGPLFVSQYLSVNAGGMRIIAVYRRRDFAPPDSPWEYSLTYFYRSLSCHIHERWEDLDAFTAHCVFLELWKKRAWYVKLWHYLRSK